MKKLEVTMPECKSLSLTIDYSNSGISDVDIMITELLTIESLLPTDSVVEMEHSEEGELCFRCKGFYEITHSTNRVHFSSKNHEYFLSAVSILFSRGINFTITDNCFNQYVEKKLKEQKDV